MSDNRRRNGTFGPGNKANPDGRPKKSQSVNDMILHELCAPVMITENEKRKRVSKLAASAKQIANKGASGELRAAKMAIEWARSAENERAAAPQPQMLGANDQEIVARFIERLRSTLIEEADDVAPQS